MTHGTPLNAVYRIGDGAKREVGSFCCPVLPVPLESPSVARWGPTALKLCNFSPLGRQLRGKSERLVIVGTCVYEPSRWHPYRSAIASLLHSSILFRPHQQHRTFPCVRCWWWRRRGTAPRVRSAYSTQH